MSNKTDVYQIVTDRIIAQLEQGTIPWHKPWIALHVEIEGRKTHTETRTHQVAYSRATGKAYSLLNQMLLARPGEWASFKQISEAGGHIKPGEKSSVAVFWKFLEKDHKDPQTGETVLDDEGNPVKDRIPMLRYYNVWHVESQCEGIVPKKRRTDPGTVTTTVTIIDDPGRPVTQTDAKWAAIEDADAAVRAYLDRSGVKLIEDPGSDEAYYAPYLDQIKVPCRAQFKTGDEFYSTLFHECIHSTGHTSRLNRLSNPGNSHFGSDDYSKEELVAEIGAACLNSVFGIETDKSFKNSAAYIQSWVRKFQEDRKMIVSASGKAEKAVHYFLTGELTSPVKA